MNIRYKIMRPRLCKLKCTLERGRMLACSSCNRCYLLIYNFINYPETHTSNHNHIAHSRH